MAFRSTPVNLFAMVKISSLYNWSPYLVVVERGRSPVQGFERFEGINNALPMAYCLPSRRG